MTDEYENTVGDELDASDVEVVTSNGSDDVDEAVAVDECVVNEPVDVEVEPAGKLNRRERRLARKLAKREGSPEAAALVVDAEDDSDASLTNDFDEDDLVELEVVPAAETAGKLSVAAAAVAVAVDDEPAAVRRARAKVAKATERAEARAAKQVEGAKKRAARRKARQQAHQANPKRRYLIAAGIAVPTVAALVFGIIWAVTPQVSHKTTADGTPIPAHAAGLSEPLVFGNAGSDTTIAIWTDFHSPLAKEQEVYSGAFIRSAAERKTARIEYYLTDILDQPDTEGSLRAANATLCADDQGMFFNYLAYAFDRQPIGFPNPDDKTAWVVPDGYSKSQLIAWGKELGIPNMDAFSQCVTDTRYKTYVKSISTKFAELGYTTVPVITKNGELLSDSDFSLDKFAAMLGVSWADQ